MSTSLGLYLHVPFCAAICNYCNFNRGLLDEAVKTRYVAALEREIRGSGMRFEPPMARLAGGGWRPPAPAADSIFFGGGTPSLLAPAEVAALIGACRDTFDLAADAEVTLEANPETVTAGTLEGFRAAGVNRISFGVQSFRDEELRRLSRLHSAGTARAAVTLARQAGFGNLSLDLMMWLPEQQRRDWLESVEALVDVNPDHASLYLLELYPNAPLKEDMARARWSQAPDEEAAEMYLAAMARLDAAGYGQYEISNVARPGRASRHNLKYWRDGAWLGFGCGAHSTLNGTRWKNVPGTEDYIARVGAGAPLAAETRRLSRQERFEDAMFTGLRLVAGVDVPELGSRYGVDVWARYGQELAPHLDAGLLVHDGRWLRLTREGMLVAHEIMTVFV